MGNTSHIPSMQHVTVHGTVRIPLSADEFVALAEDDTNIEILRQELDINPAIVNVKNSWGNTALLVACKRKASRTVILLLQRNANVNYFDVGGNSPLNEACIHKATGTADLLIMRGANVNACGRGGNTPLHDAVISRMSTIVDLMLNHNADCNIKNRRG